MAQVGAANVKCDAVHFLVVGAALDENERRIRIHVFSNEPGAGNPVHPNFFPGN